MKYTPPKTALEAIWTMLRLILVVCMFFWFGWQAGLIAILLVIEIG